MSARACTIGMGSVSLGMQGLRRNDRAVVMNRSIAASTTEVWEVISAPGYLATCHPFCAANPVYPRPSA